MNNIKITLKENGLHSLWRGIESYEEYTRTKDKWLLKEAILFIHHGIELLMKEILVQHSEYLIFADIGTSTIKKQKQANEQGVGIFYLPNPPKTVTYLDAISRIEAFINPNTLDEKLLSQLQELNRLRNQLEHYAIDVDAEQVEELLGELREPLLAFFESQIGNIRQREPQQVRQVWRKAEDIVHQARLHEQEVFELVQHFNGQEIPGYLLGAEGNIVLPRFTKVERGVQIRKGSVWEVDVLASGDNDVWIIEVKSGGKVPLYSVDRLFAMNTLFDKSANPTLWLVSFGDLSHEARQRAKDLGILFTGLEEWKELKNLLQ